MRFLILLTAIIAGFLTTPPSARTYYVASNGDDTHDGRSPQTPFRHLDKLNTIDFDPGDKIAFKGGDTFVGHLQLSHKDEGTPALPVVIESYGTGQATIQNADTSAISIRDAGGVVVRNLRLDGVNRTKNHGNGLHVINTLPKADKRVYLRIENIAAFGFGKDGIQVAGLPTDGSQSGFENVEMTHCEVYGNQYHGIYVTGIWDTNAQGYAHRNLRIAHCLAHENTGDPVFLENHSGSGMEIDDVENAVIEHCEAYNNGYLCNSRAGGPCGIWLHAAHHSVIQYCTAINNRTGRGLDGAGFDLDGGTSDCVIQYCYARDNDGAGILIWNYDQAPHRLENNILRFNILENNGRRNDYGAIHIGSGGTPVRNIQIHNNTIATSQQPRTKAAAIRVTDGKNDGLYFKNNLIIVNNQCLDKEIYSANKNVSFQGNHVYNYPLQRPQLSGVFTSESPKTTEFSALKGYRPLPTARNSFIFKSNSIVYPTHTRDFAGQPIPNGLVGALAR